MENYTKKHVFQSGTFYYNNQNQYHRLDGPAIEWHDGTKFWGINGKLHRLDGPAVIRDDHEYYYIDDKKYSEEEYWQHPDVLKYKMLQEAKAMLGIK